MTGRMLPHTTHIGAMMSSGRNPPGPMGAGRGADTLDRRPAQGLTARERGFMIPAAPTRRSADFRPAANLEDFSRTQDGP
jgi:hypothetical protein